MFFHAALSRGDAKNDGAIAWQDHSTATHFKFSSPCGSFQLLRRTAYPATYAYVEGTVLKAGYGNESAGDGTSYSEEFLHMELDAGGTRAVIRRDYFCTMPLFAVYNETQLSLSNLFEAACSSVSGLLLDKAKLYRFFTDGNVGRADTYIKGCLPIGALEHVEWKDNTLQSTPHTFADFVPADISPTTDYNDPKMFRRFFDELMKEYAVRYASQPVACEFSGGIDSAMVAGYLADSNHDPLLLTVNFPGSFKETQAAKIDDFKQRFHTRHHTVDLERTPPLSYMAARGAWHAFYQDEEIYYDAFLEHARYLAEHGIPVSFNGLGGDDVLARFDFPERQKDLPGFFINEPTKMRSQEYRSNDSFARVSAQFVMQKFSCNNVYLERGIWPVAPFTDPRLFLYCQSLKPRYRDNKNIYRMYCQAWNYPESVYHPAVNENFGPFFNRFADQQLPALAKQWLDASVLHELGLIDKTKAIDHVLHPASDEDRFQAYRLITTEINLQTLGVLKAS